MLGEDIGLGCWCLVSRFDIYFTFYLTVVTLTFEIFSGHLVNYLVCDVHIHSITLALLTLTFEIMFRPYISQKDIESLYMVTRFG